MIMIKNKNNNNHNNHNTHSNHNNNHKHKIKKTFCLIIKNKKHIFKNKTNKTRKKVGNKDVKIILIILDHKK